MRRLVVGLISGFFLLGVALAKDLPAVGDMASEQQQAHQQAMVKQLLGVFNHATRKPLSAKQIKNFYSPAVTVSVNGEQKAAGYKQLSSYLNGLLAPVKQVRFSVRSDEVIVAGDNVVAHYYVRQKLKGHWQTQQVMANFIFDHGKISQWSSVTT